MNIGSLNGKINKKYFLYFYNVIYLIIYQKKIFEKIR